MKKITSLHRCGLPVLYLFLLLTGISCRRSPGKRTAEPVKTGSMVLKYARGFNIDNYPGYRMVSIYSGTGKQRDTARYLLLPQGAAVPAHSPGTILIRTPLKSMVAMSSMHVALADFAGAADIITGLGSLKYISSAAVRKNIAAGKVRETGLDGGMNNELLISMHPGLVMVTGGPDASHRKYQTLTAAGIPVMLNAEWLETTPLGRAEWVKLMGALLNRDQLVSTKFDQVEAAYNQLAALAKKAAAHPSVISGMPYKGTWFVPDGDSYMVRFFKDAGAAYKWADVHGKGSLPLTFEAVAPEALRADYWLNPGTAGSLQDIRAADTRYADFKPWKTSMVYNNNQRTNDIGSNDYWESGAVNPQLILADLISILHPELLPGHSLYYYKKLN